MDTDALFLGLDSSTQALKASLLDADLRVLAELEVRFDSDLAHFGTRGGVLYGPDGSGEVFSPVLQPVEALDLLFDRIKDAQWEVGRIRGVSAAGQVCPSPVINPSNMRACTGRKRRPTSCPLWTLPSL